MSKTRVRVRCRHSGVLVMGAGDRDAPCPSLCGRCLDQEMTGATSLLWQDRWVRGHSLRRCIELMAERLEGIGLTAEAVERYRVGAERVMAPELALERESN